MRESHSPSYGPFINPQRNSWCSVPSDMISGRQSYIGRQSGGIEMNTRNMEIGEMFPVYNRNRKAPSSLVFVPLRSTVGISRRFPLGRALSPCDTDIRIWRYQLFVSHPTWTSCSFGKFWCTSNINICFKGLCWSCSFTQPNCLCFHQGDGYLFYAAIWALTRMFCHLRSCFLALSFKDKNLMTS